MSKKMIRIRNLPRKRIYECFKCETVLEIRERLTYCPYCGYGDDFFEMD